MKTVALLCIAAPLAAAFVAPVAPVREATTTVGAFGGFGGKKSSFDPSVQLGAQAPTGFWDPWGLSDGISEEQFMRWRTVEQKHGRIAMLAVLGYCVPEFVGTFGDVYLSTSEKVKFSDLPVSASAIFKVPTLGLAQMLLFVGLLETQFPNVNGDYGTGYFGQSLEEPVKSKKLAIELSNGRLAMLAIAGLLAHDYVTGGHPFDVQFTTVTYTSL
eukprot:CAMPEP_0185689830 /NCGR_PEP_ID=MMETSP1164-20130828/713_1 /TAXON_ID=1104430 /ORGANISM="Chrysoreinhardia sp, Strain CCMP2950" /LENGTH=214 /DNA_ID=CAMNT_0028356349 /DNA_START=45 /DNA_END=689 /DNA_ORIENTATION=+